MLNEDYSDMLRALSDAGVEFLLVGAHAMGAYGYVRATGDMDIWVMPSADNAKAVLKALERFGAPLHDLTCEDLQLDDLVFQIGVHPDRIDIITGATGLRFEQAYRRSRRIRMGDIDVPVLSLEDLIHNKRASGRTKDLADAEALEGLRGWEQD